MTILGLLRVYFQRITDKNGFDDIVLKFLYPPFALNVPTK
jgi:hypothetical protein